MVAMFGGIVDGKVFGGCEVKNHLQSGLTNAKETTVERILCHASQSSNFDSALVKTQTVSNDNDGSSENWTLYGIFQISQHFCSGAGPLCGDGCERFVDDDIADDIECVEKIKDKFLKNPIGANQFLKEMISRLVSPNFQIPCVTDCN
ncbi:alpha-lactalbumin-like [Eucyclogobius newberryi]|uniref:alpha-lactalbumin-like n=1 Tax=Eucyclogobius newberryi TaxID=166745 RepID=UPI003B5A9EE4